MKQSDSVFRNTFWRHRKRSSTAVALLAVVALVLPLSVAPVFGQGGYQSPGFEEETVTVEIKEGVDTSSARGMLIHQAAATGTDPQYTCELTPATPTTVPASGTQTEDVSYAGNLAVGDFQLGGCGGPSGLIYLKRAAFDFENTDDIAPGDAPEYVLKITAQNFTGSATQTVNFQVVNVNEPPVLQVAIGAQNVIAGGTAVTIPMGDKYTDPDADDVISYAVSSDAPQTASALYSGGTLRIRGRADAMPNSEAWITVVATDKEGLRAELAQVFSVTVGGNRPPTISEGDTNLGWVVRGGFYQYQLDENEGVEPEDDREEGDPDSVPVIVSAGVNAVLAATDANQEDSELKWSLAGDDAADFKMEQEADDSANFNLVYTGEGLDFEEKGQYSFQAVVSDASGATDAVNIVIWVNDIPEAPEIVEEYEDVVWAQNAGAQIIDLAENFTDQDTAPILFSAKTDPTGVVSVTHLGGVDPDADPPVISSQLLFNIQAQGETTMHYCVTDDITVASPLTQPNNAMFNVELYDACEALDEERRVLAEYEITVGPPDEFADDNENTHELNINKVAELGITSGCNPPDNTNYCPDNPVTRGQMATFLVRAVGYPATDASTFTDIGGSVHAADIRALAAAGVTSGCNPPTNNRFCPDRSVNRGEMATFLVNAFGLSPAVASDLTDIEGNTHEANIRALANAGITRGCNAAGTEFCPDREVTRGEMASFLIRALD